MTASGDRRDTYRWEKPLNPRYIPIVLGGQYNKDGHNGPLTLFCTIERTNRRDEFVVAQAKYNGRFIITPLYKGLELCGRVINHVQINHIFRDQIIIGYDYTEEYRESLYTGRKL